MATAGRAATSKWLTPKVAQFRRFRRDVRGTTAIEAAFVLPPFFMFIVMLMLCSLNFFVTSSIEKGMDQASRIIKTGQAVTLKWTVQDFRQAICDGSDKWIDCTKLQVWTQPYTDWSAIGADGGLHACVGQNNTILDNDENYAKLIATQAGGANDVVVVTVCYPWDFASKLPYFSFANMQNGSEMIQSSISFRTEPYPVSAGS